MALQDVLGELLLQVQQLLPQVALRLGELVVDGSRLLFERRCGLALQLTPSSLTAPSRLERSDDSRSPNDSNSCFMNCSRDARRFFTSSLSSLVSFARRSSSRANRLS